MSQDAGTTTAVRPLCPGCKEPIGAYEPLMRLPGCHGVAEPTSWLALGGAHDRVGTTLWHAACAPPAGDDTRRARP